MGFDNFINDDDSSKSNESSSTKRKYVRISQIELEEFLDNITNNWKRLTPEDDQNLTFTGEMVYEFPTLVSHDDLVGRLYSTIEQGTGKARDKGKDAMRLVIWSNSAGHPIGGRKKTLRIKTWRKNLKEKFISLHEEWEQYVNKCPECTNGWLVERSGQYGDFLGCTEYDDCTYTEQIEE